MARPTTLDQAMEHAVHLESTMLGSMGAQRGPTPRYADQSVPMELGTFQS